MSDPDELTTQRRPPKAPRPDAYAEERTDIDRGKMPSPPYGVSRVDTLPEDFVKLLSRRPHFIGEIIAGRYKLVEHLGVGAMGQVFAAENLAIGRRVAVKVLKAELLADAQFRARFQREAEAIAAIDHRNVVRCLDLVVGDPVFLVMEFVDGPTLASVLRKQRKLDPTRAINIAARLCWGLDAAHRVGVVHRDIKPANVILSPDAELGEEPRLIDFGLAKVSRPPAEDELTRDGQIVGTPHYMSPEQIASRAIDARSDLYSLGCLLYHMVAGQPPFQGDHDMQILYQQMSTKHASLIDLAPNIPPGLDAVLRRALAKDPKDRFASALEMGKALGTIERRKPTFGAVARDGGTAIIAPRRRRAPWTILAAALALAPIVAVGTFLITRNATQHRPGSSLLVVGSQPGGATVEIDGRALPETTPTFARSLQAGKHVVRFRHQGHSTFEQVVDLRAGERTIIEPFLPPVSRRVLVQTVPAGALVYLDQRLLVGQTPLTIDVAEDDFHELRFERTGYEDERRAITPDDHGEEITVHLAVERQPHGTIWVSSNRTAEVFVDGHDTGLSTPTIGIRAPVGKHVVEVRDGEGQARAASVNLAQGEALHEMLDLDAVPR